MGKPSHKITEDGDKVVIHGLEIFCAYDPQIDKAYDEDLTQFDNNRVRLIVESTRQYMDKGQYPRLVVMHERDGREPKASVGRFTDIEYQERNGIGFIIGQCEVAKDVFNQLLATNAFPRRSAEIWQDQNHLSEVALLGRETPRRPLPDTNFSRSGELITFSRPLRFDMGTVGGGLSTFVPSTKEKNMANEDIRSEMAAMRAAMDEISQQFKKHFGEKKKDENCNYSEVGEKDEMSADDMIQSQYGMDEEKEEMGDLTITHEDDDEEAFPASRRSRFDRIAIRRENAKMARELATMKAELAAEKFSRELDSMEQEGYRIPAAMRHRLVAELAANRDPAELIDTWRELFARDPMGVRIDMSRATLPSSTIDNREISELVREFAGKPEEFRKAINSRIKR